MGEIGKPRERFEADVQVFEDNSGSATHTYSQIGHAPATRAIVR
jgi:hypothetical protein